MALKKNTTLKNQVCDDFFNLSVWMHRALKSWFCCCPNGLTQMTRPLDFEHLFLSSAWIHCNYCGKWSVISGDICHSCCLNSTDKETFLFKVCSQVNDDLHHSRRVQKEETEETRALIRHLWSVWSCAFTAFSVRRQLLSVGLGALTVWGGTQNWRRSVWIYPQWQHTHTPAPALLKGLQTPAAVLDGKTGPQVIRNRFDVCWKRPGDSASNLNTSKTNRSEA